MSWRKVNIDKRNSAIPVVCSVVIKDVKLHTEMLGIPAKTIKEVDEKKSKMKLMDELRKL